MLAASIWSRHRPRPINEGPANVAAISSHEVALSCNRSAGVEIQWKFRPPGSDREQDISSRYRSVVSNYGVHSLVLVDVQLSHAGTYVCRGVGAEALKPAGAFVVVIAQKPFCHIDQVSSRQSIVTCSVTYAGEMGAMLSLIAERGGVVRSEKFTAPIGAVASTRAVKAKMLSSTVLLMPYSCRISFFTNHSHVDLAKNQPGVFEEKCYLSRTFVDTRSPCDSNADNATSTTSIGSSVYAAAGDTANDGIVASIAILCIPFVIMVCDFAFNFSAVHCLPMLL